MLVHPHSNNSSTPTSTKDNYVSYNSVNESIRNSFPSRNLAPTLRTAPPIPPRTTMTSSTHGSRRVDVNKDTPTKTTEPRRDERGNRRKPRDYPLPRRVIVHPMDSEKTISVRFRTQDSLPPQLMPRKGTPRASSGQVHLTTPTESSRPSLVLLHRAPSPHSPLHITSATPTEDCKPIMIQRHPSRATMRERTTTTSSDFQKSQRRSSSSLISWVKRRKQADASDSQPPTGRNRTPSAIFYDSEGHVSKL